MIVPEIPFIRPKLCLVQEFEEIADVRKFFVNLKGPKVSVRSDVEVETRDKKRLTHRAGFGPVRFQPEGHYKFETHFDHADEVAGIKHFYVQLRSDLKKS